MEVTDVETYTLKLPIGREVGDSRLSITDVYWVIVELETNEGYTGTGWMGSLGFAPGLLEQFVESQFAERLLGSNPFSVEAIQSDLRQQTIYYGELGMSAWPRSAIDVALWDIRAQASGQPLYRFLGGDDRRIRAYASSMDARHELDELADLHGTYADEGFTAFKSKVGGRSVDKEIDRLEAIREQIGSDADLFIDANQAWDVKETLERAKAFERFDLGWIEEPISEFDLDGHERVANRISQRLATGEMSYRPERFRWLLDRGGVDVVQPDLIRCGGISGQGEIAQLAHQYDVPVASHFYYAVSAHVIAAARTGIIVEYIPEYDIAPVLETPPTIEDGHIVLPDRPGHGYRIDEDARAEYEVEV